MRSRNDWARARRCLATLVFAGLAARAAADTAPPVLRLATLAPSGTSYHKILLQMREDWRSAPAGGARLILYMDGQQGSEPEMLRRLRQGQIQAAMLTTTGLAEIDSAVSALQDIPMAYRSLEEQEYVRSRLQAELEERLLKKGFVVLFWGDAGWIRFFSKDAALRPSDFKRLRMFVSAGAGETEQKDIMTAAGYQPISLEWTDALLGLKRDTVDALPTTPYLALAGQFDLVARHMLELNWAVLVGATVVRAPAWEALAPETREALRQAAARAGARINERSRLENDEAVAAMAKRGLQVHRMTAELEIEWRRESEGFYPRIRGKIVPEHFFDEVQRLLGEYRAARPGGQP